MTDRSTSRLSPRALALSRCRYTPEPPSPLSFPFALVQGEAGTGPNLTLVVSLLHENPTRGACTPGPQPIPPWSGTWPLSCPEAERPLPGVAHTPSQHYWPGLSLNLHPALRRDSEPSLPQHLLRRIAPPQKPSCHRECHKGKQAR